MLSLICNTWGNQLKQKVIYRNVGKIQIYRFSDQTNFRQSINRMFYCDVYLNSSNPVKRKETVLRLTQLRRFFVNKSWGEEVSNLKFKLDGSECFKNTKRNIVVTIPLLNTVYGWCLMPWVKNVCKEWKKTNIWKMFCFFLFQNIWCCCSETGHWEVQSFDGASYDLPLRFPSSVSSLKPVKLAKVGTVGPVLFIPGLTVAELGRLMVRGPTAKKLMKIVPRTNMTTRKMTKVALA